MPVVLPGVPVMTAGEHPDGGFIGVSELRMVRDIGNYRGGVPTNLGSPTPLDDRAYHSLGRIKDLYIDRIILRADLHIHDLAMTPTEERPRPPGLYLNEMIEEDPEIVALAVNVRGGPVGSRWVPDRFYKAFVIESHYEPLGLIPCAWSFADSPAGQRADARKEYGTLSLAREGVSFDQFLEVWAK